MEPIAAICLVPTSVIENVLVTDLFCSREQRALRVYESAAFFFWYEDIALARPPSFVRTCDTIVLLRSTSRAAHTIRTEREDEDVCNDVTLCQTRGTLYLFRAPSRLRLVGDDRSRSTTIVFLFFFPPRHKQNNLDTYTY